MKCAGRESADRLAVSHSHQSKIWCSLYKKVPVNRPADSLPPHFIGAASVELWKSMPETKFEHENKTNAQAEASILQENSAFFS